MSSYYNVTHGYSYNAYLQNTHCVLSLRIIIMHGCLHFFLFRPVCKFHIFHQSLHCTLIEFNGTMSIQTILVGTPLYCAVLACITCTCFIFLLDIPVQHVSTRNSTLLTMDLVTTPPKDKDNLQLIIVFA